MLEHAPDRQKTAGAFDDLRLKEFCRYVDLYNGRTLPVKDDLGSRDRAGRFPKRSSDGKHPDLAALRDRGGIGSMSDRETSGPRRRGESRVIAAP